jgi:hypothetical protein
MIKKILFILFLSITSLGFSQEKTIDGLSAAPNPFTNSTKISFTSTSSTNILFTVKNVLGKTVFKKNFLIKSGKNTIPFYKNNLSKGMYIYSIQNKEKTTSKRLVIR